MLKLVHQLLTKVAECHVFVPVMLLIQLQ